MARRRSIIKREYENETCSRRDTTDEPPWHSSHPHGPPPPAVHESGTSSQADSSDLAPLRKIIIALQRLKNGVPTAKRASDRATFTLPPAHFPRLQDVLNADLSTETLAQWYHRRARYDYEACSGRYTLRMPTAVHECFTASVVNAVDRALDGLVQQLQARKGSVRRPAIADALRRVFKGGSTTVELNDAGLRYSTHDTECGQTEGHTLPMPVRRSPDASFYHHDSAELPQMVVEVGYSQQRDQLDRIAESYIVDSQHAIRCVLGFDIPYLSRPGSPTSRPQLADRTATISIWRPALVPAGDGGWEGVAWRCCDAVPFRQRDGTAGDGSVVLSMADILPQATLATLPKDVQAKSICVSFAHLAEALNAAEQCQASIDARPTRPSPLSTPTKFRKRKRTPSPGLCDDCERDYAKQEMADLRRDQKHDRTWRSPSSNRIVWHEVKRRRSPRNSMKTKADLEAG